MAKIVVQYPDEISMPVAIGLIRAGFPQATGFAFITDWVDEDAEQQKAAAAKLDAKAHEVVELIRPTKEQWQRQRFLRQIWLRLDSLAMSGGESEASPRGISAGLSRTLRPLFPNDSSPIDALFPRTRVYHKMGHFMGVRYNRTALGKRVLEILAEEGTLGEKPDLSKLLAKS